MNKIYMIRAFVVDVNASESKVGFLGYEWGYFFTDIIPIAKWFSDPSKASKVIQSILKEIPSTMSDGTLMPPYEIHRICEMNNARNKVEFRLSVIELDIESISMKELDYWVGTVSFEHPEIIITAKGKCNE